MTDKPDEGTDKGPKRRPMARVAELTESGETQAKSEADGSPKQPTDDEEPPPELTLSEETQAKSEALKPLAPATDELFSRDPAKVAARKALEAAYAKAAAKPANGNAGGELRAKYDAADKKFIRAVNDTKGRLTEWIAARITGGTPAKPSLLPLFQLRAQVEKRFKARLGPRELARDEATAKVKLWQKAYADWSKPTEVVLALIGEYADRIDKLNADINTEKNADLAIYQLWFEVAVKHLQLRSQSVSDANASGAGDLVKALDTALGPDHEFTKFWKSGPDRGDGSVYLLDPGPDALTAKRKEVRADWEKAAQAQAKADAAFKLRPDDAATLKTKRDAVGQGRAAAVKALLEDPAP